jgi:endonuclease/exonuclease/phosphatase family metal-dependent hydrolase
MGVRRNLTHGSMVVQPLRLMTYNIRHGRGADGKVDLGRIADVIAASVPDVVTLQEVDVGRARSGCEDQAEALARRLDIREVRFAPCVLHGEQEHYGIATLSRLPIVVTRQLALPGGGRWWSEPRSALLTRLAWDASEIDVVNTHLSLNHLERALQADAITAAFCDHDLVVAGDLNCTPRSRPYRRLQVHLSGAARRMLTWPARLPILQLDHILYRGRIELTGAGVVRGDLARRASDHLPVLAEFIRSPGLCVDTLVEAGTEAAATPPQETTR